MMTRSCLLALLFCLGSAAAPAAPMPAPPTAADKARWAKQGRELPVRELLQPTLDAALPAYVPRAPEQVSGHLVGAASDVLADLAQRWIAAFRKYYPNVVIQIPPPYSGQVGAKELVKGDVDFAFVSRELVPSDVTGFKAKFGYAPLSVPVMGGTYRHFGFLDAVAFLVNKDNPIDHLSLTQLDALLSTTRYRGGAPVRTWGDLGLTGEWADKPIHVWAVRPWNGFEEFARERVLCPDGAFVRRGEWRTDLNFVDTVFPIAPGVAADRYAIGYCGLAYLSPGVKLISVGDGAEACPPSYEEVASARYPLSRLVYCNLNKAPGKPIQPALEEFIRFILSSEGQRVVLDQAVFIPLRSGQAARSRELLTP